MAEKTGISWTDHTFNVAWGCTRVSPGCARCFAEELAARFGHAVWGPQAPRRTFGAKHWAQPLAWNAAAERAGQRRRVFCSSMCDVFEEHPIIAGELQKLWPLIRRTPWLDWQLLTKRAERIASCLPADWGTGWPNVWLGVSVENQEYAQRRVPLLLPVPAVVPFLSCEPLLGPVDLSPWLAGLQWVIVGGESGRHIPSEPGRRMGPAWARDLRDQCRAAGVAMWYKQGSGVRSGMHPELDGEKAQQFPSPEPNLTRRRKP